VTERLVVEPRRPDPAAVARAVQALRSGGLLVYPTDTLYAFGGAALLPGVADRIRAAKGREERKPLPLVAADAEQARSLAADWPEAAARLAARFWPGPLTLVLVARGDVPPGITAGGASIAVRVPGLALARSLCAGAGPLVSTSANLSGEPPALDCGAALASVGPAAALALDAGPLVSRPSTIVDLSAAEPGLVREGAVGWAEVLAVLREAGPRYNRS
jgi:L-threonylcarbamoyladenylate synthase